jgi:uncharacterized protein (DUF2235 family)
MAKNLVVLIDGTGNEVATNETNVLRLTRMLVNAPSRQAFIYDPGVGTQGAPTTDLMTQQELLKVLGLGIGTGVYDRIGTAYRALVEQYEPDDRLYLFGFSRGAYIARALAGLVGKLGILERGRDNLIPYAIKLYADPRNLSLAATFSRTFCDRHPEVHFLGLWDTVKSIFQFEPRDFTFTSVVLPRTFTNANVRTIRHALAIDERRRFFRTNLWSRPADAPTGGQNVRQVWFAGVHSDVGGGYRDREGSLSTISLAWMVREAQVHGLLVDEGRRDEILGPGSPTQPDPLGTMHESLGGWWHVPELVPKWARLGPDRTARRKLYIPRGEPRFISEGSIIHASVLERIDAAIGYAPSNLPSFYVIEN